MKIKNLLIAQADPVKRKNALMKRASVPDGTRRHLLMKKLGVPTRMPTQFYNKKGRQFFLTMKGVYVVRENGKSLYGRKAAGKNASRAPKAIRPKNVSCEP